MFRKAYTFDDVSLVPKYSKVLSRSDVDISSTLIPDKLDLGVPIIASPMDSVCDVEMALKMCHLGGLGFIHRFMSIDEQVQEMITFANSPVFAGFYGRGIPPTPIDYSLPKYRVGVAIGATRNFMERAKALYDVGARVFMIDVAHGHHILIEKALKELRDKFGEGVVLITGVVATYEGTYDLAKWGADVVRVGLGSGCFTPNMMVRTETGLKKISEIELGEMVYTHTGELKEVINRFIYERDEEIMEINDIECTKNHEFYVVHSKYTDVVNDDNIHDYAEWIAAEDLTDDYLLVEL